MIFARFFRPSAQAAAAGELYNALVTKAREPTFYADLGVPDTVNGRFDMIVLHTMLVLRRLRGSTAEDLGKALLELLFRDMDRSLREMGVGDMGVGRHIKRMAKGLFGRASVYETGLDGDDALLRRALMENLYRHGPPAEAALDGMIGYLKRAEQHLSQQRTEALSAGRLDFSVDVRV